MKKVATKEEKEDLEAARKVKAVLEEGKDIRHADWNLKETAFLNQTQFISAKPVVYLVNMSEKDFLRKKNKHLPKVMEYVKANGGDPVIPYSAAFEQSIFDLPEEDQAKVRRTRGLALCSRARTGALGAHRLCVVCLFCAWQWLQTRDSCNRACKPSKGARAGVQGEGCDEHADQDRQDGLCGDPPHLLLHGGPRRGEVLADPAREQGAAGGGRHPHRL